MLLEGDFVPPPVLPERTAWSNQPAWKCTALKRRDCIYEQILLPVVPHSKGFFCTWYRHWLPENSCRCKMKVTSTHVSEEESSGHVPKPGATSQAASREGYCPACTPDSLSEHGECEKLRSSLQICQDAHIWPPTPHWLQWSKVPFLNVSPNVLNFDHLGTISALRHIAF